MKINSFVIPLAIISVGAIVFPGLPALAAKKTLRWWVPNEHQFIEMKAKFEKKNPNTEVVILNGAIDKFYTMITAGMMPDVWGPWDTPGIRADVNRNWALELTPYIKRDGKAMNIDDFFPGLMREFRVNGKQYSLPVFCYQDAYFYNTQLYAQAGLQPPPISSADKSWNWDKMVSNAQKLTKKTANGNFQIQGLEFNTWTGEQNWMLLWGAPPFSKEALKTAVPQEVHYDTPEMVNAINKAWELVFKYKIAQVAPWQFQTGKCGSSIHAGSLIMNYMKAKPLEKKWAMAPLPWAVTNSGTMWPDGWRISKTTKDKELAWRFVKFLCEPENIKFMVTDPKGGRLGTAAARKSVYRETMADDISRATGMKADNVLKVYEQADDVGIVKWQETICLSMDLVNYIDPAFQDMWSGKISAGMCAANVQKLADKALPTLFKRWLRNTRYTGNER